MELWIKASVTSEVWKLRFTHRPFLLEVLRISRRLSICISNYIWGVMNILLQVFLIECTLSDPETPECFSWCQILERSRTSCTIPYPSQSLTFLHCVFLFFSPLVLALSSTYAYLLPRIYSLLPVELPLHCSEIRTGSVVWTRETACHEKDPACDRSQKQMPEEGFSSSIII